VQAVRIAAIAVLIGIAGQCGYVENAWKKKDLH
jgi:hypothetical protein